MANALTQKPLIIDTDLATYTGAAAVKALGGVQGVRVTKLVLAVGAGGASSAGTVTFTNPTDGITIYPPIPVAASVAAYSVLYTDEPTDAKGSLAWRDFAVTGLTATGTRLFLWTDV